MNPAFCSTRHAVAFGAIVFVLLTLPIAVRRLGVTSREMVYRGISLQAGGFDYIRRQIFEENADVDIAFCGNSLLQLAIDPAYVEARLSGAIGRRARVLLLPQSWQGPDMNYFVSRDLLEHRHVKMLVIAAPAWVHRSNQPHVQLRRLIRYGDHPGALDGLDQRQRLSVYADLVVGAPRQLLSLLRPNLIDPTAGATLEYPDALGFMGRPFVRHETNAPKVAPGSMIYTGDTCNLFCFNGPPLNTFQLHFIRKTVELAREHHVLLVILHLPSPSEEGSEFVADRQLMPQVLEDGVVFAGIPSARLFGDVPASQFEDFYQDEHLNRNGMDLYTKTITPTLVELYERMSQTR